ncbi:MAG: TetR family transcriptional regulator [Bacteriovoracaceae bacterium]|nr:TetR family transcriptional regulator [Bacteriovoracaceae bacterium]
MSDSDIENIDPEIFKLFDFRPRKGDLKKLEIIRATIECLASVGLENTTYEAIAVKINTRRAHVAYHFNDKQKLYDAVIKYIVATHQQIALDLVAKAKNGKDLFLKYVEAPFVWAKKHPEQASVFLLFYYLCTLKGEYLKLHKQIRGGGADRMTYILTTKMNKRITKAKAKYISKIVQDMINGAMIDAITTNSRTIDQAWKDTLKATNHLLDR